MDAALAAKVKDFTTVIHHHLDAPADVLFAIDINGRDWLETKVAEAKRSIEKYALPFRPGPSNTT